MVLKCIYSANVDILVDVATLGVKLAGRLYHSYPIVNMCTLGDTGSTKLHIATASTKYMVKKNSISHRKLKKISTWSGLGSMIN